MVVFKWFLNKNCPKIPIYLVSFSFKDHLIRSRQAEENIYSASASIFFKKIALIRVTEALNLPMIDS